MKLQGSTEAVYDYFQNNKVCFWAIEIIHTILHVNLGLAKKVISNTFHFTKFHKSDFCRLWVRAGLLAPLARVLSNIVIHESSSLKEKYCVLVSEILLVFSKTDIIVRRAFVQKDVLLGKLNSLQVFIL